MGYAPYSVDTAISTTTDLATGDIVRVFSSATLYATAPVVFFSSLSSGDASLALLLIDGALVSREVENQLISLEGTKIRIEIGQTGVISSSGSSSTPMIRLTGDRNQILNRGTIDSGDEGSIAVAVAGSRTKLVNEGDILCEGSGVVVTSGQSVTIVNSGTISAGDGSGIVNFAGTTVHNSGLIQSTSGNGIYTGTGGKLTLYNTGIITSGDLALAPAVYGDNLADVIVNQGTINGDVEMFGNNDVFDGRGGVVNGMVRGGDGDDTFYISSSDLIISELLSGGLGGTDTLYTTVSYGLNDSQYIETLSLIGTAQVATGNNLVNTINGNHLSNTLSGLAGADTINGGGGADVVLGGADADSLRGGDDADTVDGGAGADKVFGDAGDDVLRGRTAADSLDGGADDDRLLGGLDGDTLVGGAGDDTLQGGQGTDVMYGGTESDTFLFVNIRDSKPGASHDLIASDFTAADDIIDLSAIDAKALTSGNDAFSFIGTAAFAAATPGQLRYAVVGANILVQADVNGDAVADFEVQINGQASITAAAFIL